MLRDLKLKIENFGPINEADLDIGKINIIAGKNSSGKTTISKIFYCLITAFSTDGNYLAYESMNDHLMLLLNNLQIHDFHTDELDKIRMKLATDHEYNLENIKECYDELESLINPSELNDKEFILETVDKAKRRIGGMKQHGFYWHVLSNLIKNEFSGDEQLLNNYNHGKITFYNNTKDYAFNYTLEIRDGILIKDNEPFTKPITINREAIYVETPYFLDFKVPFSQITIPGKKPYHQMLLYKKLTDQSSKSDILDDLHNEDIIQFQEKVNNMTEGSFNFDNMGFLEFKQDGKTFPLQNTSSGIKAIGMLQLLLENRKLKENSYLIMDEPEVHLHPEWQVKLAQILISLVKDLNVNLFINSHSPQFIEAMEVYSIKYGLRDDTKFYLTKKDEDSEKFNVEKIEYDNLFELYNNLGDPYDIIDQVRGENLANRL